MTAKNLSFVELLSQPNTWILLSVPFGGLIALIAWLAVATYLNVNDLNVGFATIKTEMIGMRSDINNLDGKVIEVDGKVDELNERVDGLEQTVNVLNEKVDNLDEKVDNLDGKVDNLDEKVDDLTGMVKEQNGKMDIIIELLRSNGNNPNSPVPEN